MSRDFFHVQDGRDLVDRIGSQHPDLASARREAVEVAGELMRNAGSRVRSASADWKIVVTDEDGRDVLVLRCTTDQIAEGAAGE